MGSCIAIWSLESNIGTKHQCRYSTQPMDHRRLSQRCWCCVKLGLDQLAYFPLSPQEMQLTRHFINSMYVALKISLEPRKLENFLYENKNSDFLKLIDFGFSKVWAKNTKMELSCGTLSYAAPEVLAKSYTSQCDLWSPWSHCFHSSRFLDLKDRKYIKNHDVSTCFCYRNTIYHNI